MSNLFYFIKQSLVNFKRNWSTSVGGIITIFLSLLVIGIFMVVSLTVSSIVTSVESQVTIRVFLADSAPQEQVDSLQQQIEGMEAVSVVHYTSKEEALEEYKATTAPAEQVIQQLESDNPLPASLDVELSDAQQVDQVASDISANQTFLEVCDSPDNPSASIVYGQTTVERLFAFITYLRYIGIAIVALLVFVTLIFINNTIRLSIMNRRREIGIMRLVGASNGFIRGPFLMEGVIQAIIGAALATGCIAALRAFLLPRIAEALPWLPIMLDNSMYVQIYIIFFVAAIVVGLFGSALAMRRYLKI